MSWTSLIDRLEGGADLRRARYDDERRAAGALAGIGVFVVLGWLLSEVLAGTGAPASTGYRVAASACALLGTLVIFRQVPPWLGMAASLLGFLGLRGFNALAVDAAGELGHSWMQLAGGVVFILAVFRPYGALSGIVGALLVTVQPLVMARVGLLSTGWEADYLRFSVPLVVGVVLLTIVQDAASRRLHAARRQVEQLAATDPLTGLANRRTLDGAFDAALEIALRHRRALSVLVVDIDRFKQVNDKYGHDVGDSVLTRLAAVMAGQVRGADMVARLGGEELAVLLPETDAEGAVLLAERMRKAVAATIVPVGPGDRRGVRVTVSIGVSTLTPDIEGLAPIVRADMLKAADRAVYQAKHQGRDQVVVAHQDDALLAWAAT